MMCFDAHQWFLRMSQQGSILQASIDQSHNFTRMYFQKYRKIQTKLV